MGSCRRRPWCPDRGRARGVVTGRVVRVDRDRIARAADEAPRPRRWAAAWRRPGRRRGRCCSRRHRRCRTTRSTRRRARSGSSRTGAGSQARSARSLSTQGAVAARTDAMPDRCRAASKASTPTLYVVPQVRAEKRVRPGGRGREACAVQVDAVSGDADVVARRTPSHRDAGRRHGRDAQGGWNRGRSLVDALDQGLRRDDPRCGLPLRRAPGRHRARGEDSEQAGNGNVCQAAAGQAILWRGNGGFRTRAPSAEAVGRFSLSSLGGGTQGAGWSLAARAP